MKSTPGWAQRRNQCLYVTMHNWYVQIKTQCFMISLLPHPPLPFQISSIEWFTHGKLAKLPYISEIIQNLLASQLLHSHFVSGSEIPKVKVKTRGQKIQKQHNEMIDERSNVEWILWTRKRPKQKEAKTKRVQKVKNNRGKKTWRSKIKGGQEVKKRRLKPYTVIYPNTNNICYEIFERFKIGLTLPPSPPNFKRCITDVFRHFIFFQRRMRIRRKA